MFKKVVETLEGYFVHIQSCVNGELGGAKDYEAAELRGTCSNDCHGKV